MAASDLYPPLLASALPAFVYSQGIYTIPFNVSQYNSPQEISKWIQISVVNPFTGQSLLNTKYPNGIVTVPANNLSTSQTLTGTKHYVRLDGGDLLENPSEQSLCDLVGQYLKIQLRFCSSRIAVPSPVSQSWLAQNIDQFSQWSKATLVKVIGRPTFLIDNDKFIDDISLIYTDSLLRFSGKAQFVMQDQDYNEIEDTVSKQKLLYYKVELYQYGSLLQGSGTLSSQNNSFSYTFKKKLINTLAYSLKFTYKTINGYSNSLTYNFKVSIQESEKGHIKSVTVSENEARGAVNLAIRLEYDAGENVFNSPKCIQIRRSDNFSNYQYWETLHYVEIPLSIKILNYQWIDETVDADRWYQYQVREVFKRNELNLQPIELGKPKLSDKILIDFEDIFLGTIDSCLKIKFNPQISGYKRVTQDSVVNTLGSQFPFVRKNGLTDYHQFSLKALISCAQNDDFAFLSMEKKLNFYNSYYNNWRQGNGIFTIYDRFPLLAGSLATSIAMPQFPQWKQMVQKQQEITTVEQNKTNEQEQEQVLYQKFFNQFNEYYTKEKNIAWTNDFLWQRFYRQAVSDFLFDGKPKLFRSATQGNKLVYLNNISFTPNKTLGRTIYEVSMQCTEIAEATLQNLKKYGIIENDLQQVVYRYVFDAQRYDPIGQGDDGPSVLIAKNSVQPIQDTSRANVPLYKIDLGTMNDLKHYHTTMPAVGLDVEVKDLMEMRAQYLNTINIDSHAITATGKGEKNVPEYKIYVSRQILGFNKMAGEEA